MRALADFIIEHATLIATPVGPAPLRGPAQRELTLLRDGVVASHDGVIVYVGAAAHAADSIEIAPDAVRVDAKGCTVVPGFVDPHTHLVFAGNRDEELRRRLSGATYEEIAASGGGIGAGGARHSRTRSRTT